MSFKNSTIVAYMVAMGYPQTPEPPDGVAVGPIGYRATWTENQAVGSVLDIPQATGAARLGAVLDGFSTAAAPDVVARFSRVTARIDAGGNAITPALLKEIESSLYLSFSPSNGREIRVPLFGSLSTWSDSVTAATTDTATTIESYAAGDDRWIPLAFPDIDLSQDLLRIVADKAISGESGTGYVLDVWFDGILARKSEWDGKRGGCDSDPVATRNLSLQRQSPRFLSKMV